MDDNPQIHSLIINSIEMECEIVHRIHENIHKGFAEWHQLPGKFIYQASAPQQGEHLLGKALANEHKFMHLQRVIAIRRTVAARA